jgi:hypothetical protein
MGTATVVSLTARPSQVSHLCFEADGIIEELNVQLGSPVGPFPFTTFYNSLNAVTSDASLLAYNSLGIQKDPNVQAFTLAALRAESRKAVLDKAVCARQNWYYANFQNLPAIVALMQKFYSPTTPNPPGPPIPNVNSKPDRLVALSIIAQKQADALSTAYINDKRKGVVRTTQSDLHSTTQSRESSHETGRTDEQAVEFLAKAGTFPAPPANAGLTSVTIKNWNPDQTTEMSSSEETSHSKGFAYEHQTIVNTDYGYRIPFLECLAQNQRAQISLMDQQFAQFMYGQNLPNLKTVFENQLESIYLDIKRLQVAYLNTILLSPIEGFVTGIYKNLGDSVRAGEPVIRVENNSTVYLVGTLRYRGVIALGSTVTVNTTLFDAAGATMTPFEGTVVAARGHPCEGDQWNVIISHSNLNGLLPLGYHFDYDNTSVII